MFKVVKNEVTGKNNIITSSKLISLGSAEMTNTNGTKYRIATVEITTQQGEVKQVTAMVYDGNIKKANETGGFVAGDVYLTTIAPGDERGPIVTLSHLQAGERLSADDFDFSEIIQTADVAS